MLPFRIITYLKEMIGSLWNESEHNRALLLGLPSILLGSLGVVILLWAKFGIANSLENRYLAQLEDSAEEKSRLVVELNRDLRMLRASQPTNSDSISTDDLIPKDDPRRLELESLRNREQVYLQKLIDLNPDDSEYLFKLAIAAFESQNRARGLALMNMTAPLDEPGYIKAHLWLAGYYTSLKPRSAIESNNISNLALAHVEQCLKREQDNSEAKKAKATILWLRKRKSDLPEAYQIFEELFQEDPTVYKKLVAINNRLEKTERNAAVLDSAIVQFDKLLENKTLNIAEEIEIWRELMTCYLQNKQYSQAEKRLLEIIERQSEMDQNAGKIWAERALAGVYVAWTSSIEGSDSIDDKKRLEFLKKAFELNEGNADVKRRLTRLGFEGDNAEVKKEAVSIYDALADFDAPGIVLNEIGSDALSREDYGTALRYYEMARKKSPQNPDILNNLAYAYIVGDQPNPRRALTLVDEAIRRIPSDSAEARNYWTHLRDTRGQALMHLDKWTEAAAEFELALKDRPENQKILESLIKCYRADGLDPSAYVERLRVVKEADPTKETNQGAPKSSQ